MADSATLEAVNIDQDAGDFTYPEDYEHDAGYGLTSKTIDYISDIKKEADWVRKFRHKALKVFELAEVVFEIVIFAKGPTTVRSIKGYAT